MVKLKIKKLTLWLDHSENAKDDRLMETAQILKNAKNAQEFAFRLFPNEQWIGIDQHIFMAASRALRSGRQAEILDHELAKERLKKSIKKPGAKATNPVLFGYISGKPEKWFIGR